ncbi:MAG TPA: glutamyl-tRNA reductase [Vicinamibacterales bacterium]|nr:glutamyl-tRNA reductase [Vicinamibacterales bacterium]
MSDTYACPHQDSCAATPAHAHFHTVAAFSGVAALRVITINHRHVDLSRLQNLSAGCEAVMQAHEDLSGRGIESFALATCNRTELYWRARVPGDDETARRRFAHAVGLSEAALDAIAVRLSGEAAARHLFRVCCGLESLVLGEAEILGQVRAAMEACAGAGRFLQGVVQAALRTGRLARTETAIGNGALSVASSAVQWLAELLPLPQRRALVVGAGDTGFKAARHLAALGVGDLAIVNRTAARGEAAAAAIGARGVGLDRLLDELREADAVVCAASGPEWLIRTDALREAVRSRPGRPLYVVDLAVPACVEPGNVAGVERIDLGSLQEAVESHRSRREAEVANVEAVVERELKWLHAWARHQALRPLVSDLRRKVEAIRRAELARAQEELAAAPQVDPAVLERLSRRLLEQVLAIPLATLEAGELPLDVTHAEYLRKLFALEPGAAKCA